LLLEVLFGVAALLAGAAALGAAAGAEVFFCASALDPPKTSANKNITTKLGATLFPCISEFIKPS
jgi:hypothetical protein